MPCDQPTRRAVISGIAAAITTPALAGKPRREPFGQDGAWCLGQSNGAWAGMFTEPLDYPVADRLNDIFRVETDSSGAYVLRPGYNDTLVHNGVVKASPATTFARQYAASNKLAAGRRVVTINSCVRGSSIYTWGPGSTNFTTAIAMLTYAMNLSGENRVVAINIQNGETDILNKINDASAPNALSFKNALISLINRARNVAGGNIPVTVGEPPRDWFPGNAIKAQFAMRAQEAVAEVGNAAWVPSDGLGSNYPTYSTSTGELIHFNGRAAVRLGTKHWQGYRGI